MGFTTHYATDYMGTDTPPPSPRAWAIDPRIFRINVFNIHENELHSH